MSQITYATGVPSFKGAGLIADVWSKLIQMGLYKRTYLGRTTSTTYIGEIKYKGAKITIPRVPEVDIEGLVHLKPYEVKEKLADSFEMTVNRGLRWSQAYSEYDQARSNIADLDSKTLMGVQNRIDEKVNAEFISEFPDLVTVAGNKGNSAGVISGGYTLGTAANPVEATFSNIVEYLMQFSAVLDETDVNNESGQRSILIPTIMGHYLKSSEKLIDASKIGGTSSLKTQYLTNLPGIGQIYTSNQLPKLDNGAFPILCYTKEAINYVMAVRKTRVIKEMELYDATLLRGYAIYDWGVARPEGLALGYAKPSQTAIATAA